MTRKIRLEYPGALYHVTARGVQKGAIFLDDFDRRTLLRLMSRTFKSGHARAFAYCLMGNHYHLVIQTQQANLSALMHRINSAYSQAFNRRHGRNGHVLEGRFQAIHVDRDGYLLKVCRYVDLNPVRAGLVESPALWNWSSYRAHVGQTVAPDWLAVEEMLGALTGHAPACESDFEEAQQSYADWVTAGREVRLWSESLRDSHYLGDDAFIERIAGRLSPE